MVGNDLTIVSKKNGQNVICPERGGLNEASDQKAQQQTAAIERCQERRSIVVKVIGRRCCCGCCCLSRLVFKSWLRLVLPVLHDNGSIDSSIAASVGALVGEDVVHFLVVAGYNSCRNGAIVVGWREFSSTSECISIIIFIIMIFIHGTTRTTARRHGLFAR